MPQAVRNMRTDRMRMRACACCLTRMGAHAWRMRAIVASHAAAARRVVACPFIACTPAWPPSLPPPHAEAWIARRCQCLGHHKPFSHPSNHPQVVAGNALLPHVLEGRAPFDFVLVGADARADQLPALLPLVGPGGARVVAPLV